MEQKSYEILCQRDGHTRTVYSYTDSFGKIYPNTCKYSSACAECDACVKQLLETLKAGKVPPIPPSYL